MDLVSLRHTEDPERVDMKTIVKQATKSAFKLYDLERKDKERPRAD
jgi:hypothetical protein